MAKPKLSDVAALAGVSPTTVSRVLNNRGYLSEATRTKVHEAVQQLGYRPNAIARSLQGRRSQTVGLIFPTVANPFYGEMVYQLENHLAEAGYRVILCNSEDHPEQEKRYLDMLFANQVDGIISGAHSDALVNVPHAQAPLVTVDRLETGFYPNIRSDNYGGARAATEHLIATGAQTIVHVTSTLGEHNERQRGYREAMLEAGLTPEFAELGFHPSLDYKRETLYRYLDERTDSINPVEAIFASNDNYAALALGWARTHNIRVPEDFQVIGYDGTQSVRLLLPELATVIQPIEEIARRAVQRLLELIERQDAPVTSGMPNSAVPGDSAYLPGDILPITLYLGSTVRTIPNLSRKEPNSLRPDEPR